MFVLAYLWTMFWRALEATGRGDLIFALLLAALSVAFGIEIANWAVAEALAVALLLWFGIEFLVLSPARHWRDSRGRPTAGFVTFEQGSIAPGATVVVYESPGQLRVWERLAPLTHEVVDDDPLDTETTQGGSSSP